MERWRKLNVYVSLGGLLLFIVSLLFVKYNPLVICIAFFGLGIAFKGFKNIYKNVEPPNEEIKKTPNYNLKHKKKKKSK